MELASQGGQVWLAIMPQLVLYSWVLASLWQALRGAQQHVSARKKSRSKQQAQDELHRLYLANQGFLRSTYLGGAVVYVAALTYVQASDPNVLKAGQLTGLLMAYCVAVFVVWSTVVALVPFFEGMLADWSYILAIITFAVYSTFCNFAPGLGTMHSYNNVERVLSYNLFWLLEDVPLGLYRSSLGSMSVLHLITHIYHSAIPLSNHRQIVILAIQYLTLGWVVPVLLQKVVQTTLRPIRFPSPLFRMVCVGANVLSVTDLVLSIPHVAHNVHDVLNASLSGSGAARVPAALIAKVLPLPASGQRYAYGLAPGFMLSCSAVLVLVTLTSSVVLTMCEEPSASSGDAGHPSHEADKFISWLSKFEAMKHVLGFTRSMSMSHRYVLCGLISLANIQMVALASVLLCTLLLPTHMVLSWVPTVLVSVLLGLLLQVLGVMYLVMPYASKTQETATAKQQGSSDSQSRSVPPAVVRPKQDPRVSPDRPAGSQSSNATGSAHGTAQREEEATEGQDAFVARLEALAHYKAFMQGLDAQPETYTIEDLVNGSASAMRGVFPQVHHASFCLLNASNQSINMFTFIGEGSQKPPRFNVGVAPSTLIYNVLHNCRPMFISNIATFPGPFSDVQFMRFVLGLKSIACLPLVSAQGRVLGVLRLGFQVPWEWTDPEKNIAKQVAFILSSGRSMNASVPQGTVFPWLGVVGPHTDAGSAASSTSHGPASVHMHGAQGMLLNPGAGYVPQLGSEYAPALSGMSTPAAMSAAAASVGGAAVSAMHVSQRLAGYATSSKAGSVGGWRSPMMTASATSAGGALNPAVLGALDAAGDLRSPRSPGSQRWDAGSMYSQASGSAHPPRTAPSQHYHRSGTQGGALGNQGLNNNILASQDIDGMEGPETDANGDPSLGPLQRGQGLKDLKLLGVIGRGGFGSVYKADWRGKLVAVKVLEHGDEFLGCVDGGAAEPVGSIVPGEAGKESVNRKLDLSGRRAALLEGAMTSTINHPNVVATYDYQVVHLAPGPPKGLGTSSRVSQETHIVMEWCDRGSLQDAVEKGAFSIKDADGKKTIDMEALCMTLAEVASAMAYLHAHRITHRDLKPKNVLLKSASKDRRGFSAKVSDFGLSQVLPDTNRTQVSKNYSGTVTHMPPELIEDGKVYPQGDVYAFGIMMWEAFTGSTPYAHMAHPQIMVAVVTHNLRPRFQESCPAWYKNLAYKCWAKDPKSRPTFTTVTEQLLSQIQDPNWEAVATEAPAE